MPTDGLFASRSLRVVKLGLDAFALRGRVIAQNIANMATPGYRAEKVAFEESLREALANGESMPGAQTRPEHRPIGGLSLDEVRARVFESEEPLLPGDPNNVIVEQEMADLAQNQLLFQAAARMAAGHYATLKAAIRGHGR